MAAAVVGGLHLRSAHLVGADAYHHLRLAQLIGQHGPLAEFPWWRYAIYRDHYADKEPLYHLLLVPFTVINPETGGKIAALLSAVAVFLSFYLVASRLGVRWAAAWLCVLLASGGPFLFRLMLCRPHVPALALLLGVLYFMIRARSAWVLFLSCLYTLVHSTAPLVLPLAVLSEFSRYVTERRVAWGVIAAAAAGLGAGVLIHPNFPDNLVVHYIQAWTLPLTLFSGGTPDLGIEARSVATHTILTWMPIPLAAFIGGCLIARRKPTRCPHDTYTLLCVSLLTLGMVALSRRFVELFSPVALLFAATVLRDVEMRSWPPQAKAFGLFVSASIVFVGVLRSLEHVNRSMRNDMVAPYRQAAVYIRDEIPHGEVVFTADWDDYPFLSYFNPHHLYLVGLDAAFMRDWQRKVYAEWDRLRQGRGEDVLWGIAERFRSPVVVATKDHRRLIALARADPRVRIPVDNQHLVVLDLRAFRRRDAVSSAGRAVTGRVSDAMVGRTRWPPAEHGAATLEAVLADRDWDGFAALLADAASPAAATDALSDQALVETLRDDSLVHSSLAVSFVARTRYSGAEIERLATLFPEGRMVAQVERCGVLLHHGSSSFVWEALRRGYTDNTSITTVAETLETDSGTYAYSCTTGTACVTRSPVSPTITPLTIIGTLRGPLASVSIESTVRIEQRPQPDYPYYRVALYDPGRSGPWLRLRLALLPESSGMARPVLRPVEHEYLRPDGQPFLKIRNVVYGPVSTASGTERLPLSAEIQAIHTSDSGTSFVSSTTQLDVLEWRLGVDLDEGIFVPAFPAGAEVRDSGLEHSYVVAEAPTETLAARAAWVVDLLSLVPQEDRWWMADDGSATTTASIAQATESEPREPIVVRGVHPLRTAVFVLGVLIPGVIAVRSGKSGSTSARPRQPISGC